MLNIYRVQKHSMLLLLLVHYNQPLNNPPPQKKKSKLGMHLIDCLRNTS